eukprot:COSAG06_NODE_27129_length_600_cov_0.948104_2_plen_143_part_01
MSPLVGALELAPAAAAAAHSERGAEKHRKGAQDTQGSVHHPGAEPTVVAMGRLHERRQCRLVLSLLPLLLNEAMQICRQKAQYTQDGGGWNLVDVFTSACLITAAISHFSGEPKTIRTFGSIGVACKWFGCETAHLPASMLLC